MRHERTLVAAAVAVAAGVVIWLLPGSLRVPVQPALSSPPDSACADRPYAWARADSTQRLPSGAEEGSADAFRGDSIRLTNVSFRPGTAGELVWSGLLWNRTGSTIEIRGYDVEYLSEAGDVVGRSSCRVRMGVEQCGVHGTNLKRPGEIALIPDTLKGAPDTADRDTARIFWSYCVAPPPEASAPR
jgi:hypothetical protein